MTSYRIGDRVYVRKYGHSYGGTVVKVASTGTLMIEFTPANGNTKVTRIDSRDVGNLVQHVS